jgi:acyl carrier protein
LSENEQKLRRAFATALDLDEAQVVDELAYGVSVGWDSIAHMSLVQSLDDTFAIMLDTDDVLDMSSFTKARDILQKYGIEF